MYSLTRVLFNQEVFDQHNFGRKSLQFHTNKLAALTLFSSLDRKIICNHSNNDEQKNEKVNEVEATHRNNNFECICVFADFLRIEIHWEKISTEFCPIHAQTDGHQLPSNDNSIAKQ